MTNRDLYLFVLELAKRKGFTARPLADYLRNLRDLSMELCARPVLSAAQFKELLARAADGELAADLDGVEQHPDFKLWLGVIDRQIVDLDQMQRNGTLQSEMRYFGTSAPSRSYWFNFDPATFLECGCAGHFGGWQEGDDSGRAYVPGDCVVVNERGEFTAVDPRSVPDPVVELRELPWSELADFLMAAQQYE